MDILLCWDATGTLFEGVEERFTSYGSGYLRVNGDSKALIRRQDLFDPGMFRDAFQRFRGMNTFVHSGKKDGYAAIHAALQGERFRTEEAFAAFRESLPPARREAFKAAFREAREEMYAAHPEEWHAMQPPYQGAREELEALAQDPSVRGQYIVSTNREDFLLSLVEAHGFGGIFPEPSVIGDASDKPSALERIAGQEHVPRGAVVLVDDSFAQVLSCYENGARVIMAGWGYNTEQQRHEARQRRIFVAEEIEHLTRALP